MNIGFTSPVTQKKNGVIEQGFTTLYYKTIKMMAHTGLHDKPRLAYVLYAYISQKEWWKYLKKTLYTMIY